MKETVVFRFMTVFSLLLCLGLQANSQEKKGGEINWVEGYVRAIGEGTATPSGNKARDQMRALRAATVVAQRFLLETVKGVKIDSQTTVANKLVQQDVIKTRVEGTIQGAEVIKQDVRWDGDTPIATVELQICLGGLGACKSEQSIINALNLDQKSEQDNTPSQRLNDTVVTQVTSAQKVQDVTYDSSRPVTGIILNLHGLFFERVILPVVISVDGENKPLTVYSVKSVEPEIIRTYGVVRYTDSVEQARQNPYLGDNVLIVPVSAITRAQSIVLGYDVAQIVRETIRYGNDYLRSAKVIIAAK